MSSDILDSRSGSFEKAWNGLQMQEIRQLMLRQEWPPGCSSCEMKERFNGRSHRTYFATQMETERPDAKSEDLVAPVDLQRIDFSFSNLCNLRCRFCGPWNSTKWQTDAQKLATDPRFSDYGEVVPLVNRRAEELVELVEKSPHLTLIELKGGEPFLSDELPRALQLLAERGHAKRLKLAFATNGTILRPETTALFREFFAVHLSVSVEATGELYRYLRGEQHGLDVIETSLRHFDSLPTVQGEVHMALSAYSLFEPVRVQAWLEGLNLRKYRRLHVAPVVSPDHLSPLNVPRELRERAAAILADAPWPDLRKLGHSLLDGPEDGTKWDTLKIFTKRLDRIRGTSLIEVAPEFRGWME